MEPQIELHLMKKHDVYPALIGREQALFDYRIAVRSRQVGIGIRREVLNGRAKFGAASDGKEIASLAVAQAFRPGDWRCGYYRGHTLAYALGIATVRHTFAGLYANSELSEDLMSAGRQMPGHHTTRGTNDDGSWADQTIIYNSAPDSAAVALQMPHTVGLAQASQMYRHLDVDTTDFSNDGNEVVFNFIGNGSAVEGHFWETVNAIGVLQLPAILTIWDDGYGISVRNELQMVKEDFGAILSGFQRENGSNGLDIYQVPGWDYAELVRVYQEAADNARRDHIPALVHVTEMTQPLGHSTSGSHERYKSAERLQFEKQFDPIPRMRDWMLANGLADEATLTAIDEEEAEHVERERKAAWSALIERIGREKEALRQQITTLAGECEAIDAPELIANMQKMKYPRIRDLMEVSQEALIQSRHHVSETREALVRWRREKMTHYHGVYAKHLLSESSASPLNVEEVRPTYSSDEQIPAFELLNRYFKALFADNPRVVTFGEDVGELGGVNQTMAGMQEMFGRLRVSDTGIREVTILGQAIGLALRGLRPIAEIQYLDYVLYCLQLLSDDVATMRWRSYGQHRAPLILRTRGHRLEGIWHAGSPMAGILNLVRGVHVCVPRDAVRAAGFYNTLLQGDDPGFVIEVLSGYRMKERVPDNLLDIHIPLGVPETLREGGDVTLVTYGYTCHPAMDAAAILAELGIDVEVIDVQSLLPFDRHHAIVESVKKTNRLLVVDEDVPGGASAYIVQNVVEKQGGYDYLDAPPTTVTGTEHRPPYGADGGYFSKPWKEQIVSAVYGMMHENDPGRYPEIF